MSPTRTLSLFCLALAMILVGTVLPAGFVLAGLLALSFLVTAIVRSWLPVIDQCLAVPQPQTLPAFAPRPPPLL